MVAPLVKWPGGKTRELPAILAALPEDMGRLVDPFVGGGAVLFALPASVPAVVNDASRDLVALYRAVQSGHEGLFERARALAAWWDDLADVVAGHASGVVAAFTGGAGGAPDAVAAATHPALQGLIAAVVASTPGPWDGLVPVLGADLEALVPRKLARMRTVEVQRGRRLPEADVWRNVEGAVRAALYTRLRTDYNHARTGDEPSAAQTARFLFLREFAYAAMFRFNARGEFNVPYGGITYNRKSFGDRVDHLCSAPVVDRLATTTVHGDDFACFLANVDLRPDDVVFLDPPYDSDFSAYDGNGFDGADHERLARAMRALPCRFQMVVKDTPMVRDLYLDPAWHVTAFDRTYAWTIKERNDRRATHLLITDVEPGVASTATG